MSEDLEKVIPSMNVNMPTSEVKPGPVSEDLLMGTYTGIFNDLKESIKETDETLQSFLNLALNDGDSSSATKEAVVNLLKLKTVDIPDKMIKVADLMTRVYLKEKDTFPRYLAAKQENTINIHSEMKKDVIKKIKQEKEDKTQ